MNLKKSNFTLVEILVALAVASIGMVGLYSSMSLTRQTQVSVKRRIMANRLINEKLDEMLLVDYKDLILLHSENNGHMVEDIPAKHWTGIKSSDSEINYSVDFSYNTPSMHIVTTPDEDVCAVTVWVTWFEGNSNKLLYEYANIFRYNNQ